MYGLMNKPQYLINLSSPTNQDDLNDDFPDRHSGLSG